MIEYKIRLTVKQLRFLRRVKKKTELSIAAQIRAAIDREMDRGKR